MAYGTVLADTLQTSTSGGILGAGNASIMKNRIINGAMVIDQRNAGASITPTSGQYSVDRWAGFSTAASKYSLQQNAGSVTPPVGFTNYLGATSLSAYSVGSGDIFTIQQRIEGFNTADLGWGTANAKTVTLSFWVYSSLTGTFGGAITNNTSRSYPFSYSVPVANTWTQISVTIAGDTTGTWTGATNAASLYVCFGLGGGSTYSATAGSWQAGAYYTATGATSVVGTNGATFYITGVQLEVGSSATGYEYRQYGQELALCQRYYQNSSNYQVSNYTGFHYATSGYMGIILPVTMRTSPTVTMTGFGLLWYEAGSSYTITSVQSAAGVSPQAISIQVAISGGTSGYAGTAQPIYQASAEL